MDQEEKELLRRILETTQKNNKMLSSIKQSMLWSRIFTYVYWIIILGTAVGVYYYLQPYIDDLLKVYGGFKGNINNILGQ